MSQKDQQIETSEVQRIFKDKVIPEEFQVPFRKSYGTYLIDGELREWKGKTAQVLSPIYTRDKEGKLGTYCAGDPPGHGRTGGHGSPGRGKSRFCQWHGKMGYNEGQGPHRLR